MSGVQRSPGIEKTFWAENDKVVYACEPPSFGHNGGYTQAVCEKGRWRGLVPSTGGQVCVNSEKLDALGFMKIDEPFHNLFSQGMINFGGAKMSKSKGNAVNPFETIEAHGADATRWYMISNSQPWDNLKFDPEGLVETRNKFFGTFL